MAGFVHLHNHSEYSLLDGLSKIPVMVKKAKDLGMSALAITDHGNLYGALKFYHECLSQGVKPIIGSEMYLAKRSRTDKEQEHDSDYNHLILLAKNNKGYKNLIKLVSIAQLEGFYYKPRIDLESLEKYHEGIIALSACLNGYFAEEIMHGKIEAAEVKAERLAQIFGDGNFYLEIQRHPKIPDQEKLNEGLIKLSKKLGIPLVATNDNHYVNKEDADAQDILLAIQTQTTILDAKRTLTMIDSPDFYIKTPEEMETLFRDVPEAVENTVKIAEKIDLTIETGKWVLPHFDVPGGMSHDDYLKKLVNDQLSTRYKEISEELRTRIDYELSVITSKGYTTYFLIVQDFVIWAKAQGIAVGPGRGSVAGSVVSYILRITELDPIVYGLPFERFLNPHRPTPPDIDMDFADDKRDEVIAYVTQKYGKEKVSQIITFGTMEARAAVRDVGRALGMPYAAPDRIAKMIPAGAQGFAMTIEKALELNPDLDRAYRSESETKKLLDLAKKLEGVARHASTHAAGVIIADMDLTNYVPLQREVSGDKIITQFDMYDLDMNISDHALGLLKIDFLGLRNLTIIQNALKFIKANQGKDLDLSTLTLDDEQVFKTISSGETTGIFQLESQGMRRLAKDLHPTKISDLSAMIALFRPGPMAWIGDFIQSKNHAGKVNYPHPDLKPILEETYGIAVYQEQCMLIANQMGSYTMAEADNLRKAIGKKKPELMRKEREKFIAGCLKNGYTQKIAEDVFSLIEKFVGYGFNKAHSASYAIIAYHTGYLKTYYPVEFMTAVLTAESRGSSGPIRNEKISQAISECKRLKIQVLPPSLNKSDSEFSIEDSKKIRFGLSAIKNVGGAAIGTILEARSKGPFVSFTDFLKCVDLSKVNKKTLESLIKAGAMDDFGKRAVLLISFAQLVDKINKEEKQKLKNQTSLFGDEEDSTISSVDKFDTNMEEFSEKEKLMFEKELLGFFLTNHPLSQEVERIEEKISHKIGDLQTGEEGVSIKIGGFISSIKKIITKKGNNEMAFVTIEDHSGSFCECVVFPRIFESFKGLLLRDSIVIIEGKLQFKDERPVVIVDVVSTLSN